MMGKREVKKAKDIFFKVGTGVAVFGIIFFATFLSSSHFMPISKSSAETTGDYYANITNTGAIDIDLVATPDGYGKVGKDTLSISTNATSGYKLYLSTASTAPNNSLYLSTDSTKGITATTGSISAPSKLASNTWGYVPSRSNPSDTVASYTDAAADADNGDAVFIGVPEYGDENVIYTNDTPTVSGSNSVDIYYGVNASTALPSGEYSNTVVYTAIVDAVNPSNEEVSISPTSQNGLSAGTEVTISTGLYPGFAATDIGQVTVTLGGNACTNVASSIGESGNLVITCNTPAAASAGSVDVVVTVAKYGKTYTLTGGYEYVQSTPEFFTITKMQEMTRDICQDSSLPTPSAGETTALTKSAWENGTRIGIPTTTLLDDRSGQISYTVKKLTDGQCWMTQNLRLPAGASLNSSNSDLDGTVVSNYTLPANSSDFSFDPDLAQIKTNYANTTDDPRGYTTGVYYSWRAATAGTGRGVEMNDSGAALNDVFGTDMNTSGNNTAVSICPKGWRLPTGGSGAGTTAATAPGSTSGLTNGDFQRLYSSYGGTGTSGSDATMYSRMTGTSYGPNLALSGTFTPSGRWYTGTEGHYWSSTNVSKSSAYDLGVFDTYINSTHYSLQNKQFGFPVRCVAR